MGPRARQVLARVTEADLGNAAFPYGSLREISAAGSPVRAVRISYAGELGWELYVAVAEAARLYDALAASGDLVDGGYYASTRCA
jgi:glycine cleavage system aminomethyltransferase T